MSFYTSSIIDLDAARAPTETEIDAVDRMKPVELRIDAVLSRIPAAVARQGVPLALIQGQLKGRTRGALTCQTAELSRALHKRGWRRHVHMERRYEGVCETLWYPPGVEPVKQVVEDRPKLPRGRPPKWLAYARARAKAEGRNI